MSPHFQLYETDSQVYPFNKFMTDSQVYLFNKCKDYGDIFDFLFKKSYILIVLSP